MPDTIAPDGDQDASLPKYHFGTFGSAIEHEAEVIQTEYKTFEAATKRGLIVLLARAAALWRDMGGEADTFKQWCVGHDVARHGDPEKMLVRLLFNDPPKNTRKRWGDIIVQGCAWLEANPGKDYHALAGHIETVTMGRFPLPPVMTGDEDPEKSPFAQQRAIARWHGSGTEYESPQWLFDLFDSEFGFTLDAAASAKNAKCPLYYTREDDGLSQDWGLNVVWVDPPFGPCIEEWYEKALASAQAGATVVVIGPAYTEHDWWDKYENAASEIRYIKGQVRFLKPDGERTTIPRPLVALIFRPPEVSSDTDVEDAITDTTTGEVLSEHRRRPSMPQAEKPQATDRAATETVIEQAKRIERDLRARVQGEDDDQEKDDDAQDVYGPNDSVALWNDEYKATLAEEATIEKLIQRVIDPDATARAAASNVLWQRVSRIGLHSSDIHVSLNGSAGAFPLIEQLRAQNNQQYRELDYLRSHVSPEVLREGIKARTVEYRWGEMEELIRTRITGDSDDAIELSPGWKINVRKILGIGPGLLHRWQEGTQQIPQDAIDTLAAMPMLNSTRGPS